MESGDGKSPESQGEGGEIMKIASHGMASNLTAVAFSTKAESRSGVSERASAIGNWVHL